MTKPLVCILDTDSKTQIVREMTDEEYAQHLIDEENSRIEIQKEQAKLDELNLAKNKLQEKLEELGLSSEIIQVIKKIF